MAEQHSAWWLMTEHHSGLWHCITKQHSGVSTVMLTVANEPFNAKSLYAGCHYGECLGTSYNPHLANLEKS